MRLGNILCALVVACGVGAVANSWRPRTLDEKVEEASLIVQGTASLAGAEKLALKDGAFVLYERNLRVDVSRVLWPPALPVTNITFRFYIVKTWPASWWAYTNTPGVFFLVHNPKPENGEWKELDRFDDWMEPTTNAPLVTAAIKRIKATGAAVLRQPIGAANRSQPVRSETNQSSAAAGSGR
jgi:hypothetical protein